MKPSPHLAVFALAIGIALTGGARAQDSADQDAKAKPADTQHAPPSPEQQLERMTKRLQLTPDQVEKIGPLLENRHDALDSLRKDSSIKEADRQAQMQSITQDSEQRVEAVLTDTQRQQYEQAHDKPVPRHAGKHPQADAADGTN